MKRVGVINYGVGNLRSVGNALNHLGHVPVISDNANELLSCEAIVFPGVGAFGYGIKSLRNAGLDNAVLEAAENNIPVLGICLGMQLLFEKSSEFGSHTGLGILQGSVNLLEANDSPPASTRLPNVGWCPVSPAENDASLQWLFSGIASDARFYFVHSYCAAANSPGTIATATYANQQFAAITTAGSVIGTQFHPEKSGPHGLRMLDNFINQGGCA